MVFFYNPLETSENQRFSVFFRRYRAHLLVRLQNFPKNEHFLHLWYTIWRLKKLAFRKILLTYKMNDPIERYQWDKMG